MYIYMHLLGLVYFTHLAMQANLFGKIQEIWELSELFCLNLLMWQIFTKVLATKPYKVQEKCHFFVYQLVVPLCV